MLQNRTLKRTEENIITRKLYSFLCIFAYKYINITTIFFREKLVQDPADTVPGVETQTECPCKWNQHSNNAYDLVVSSVLLGFSQVVWYLTVWTLSVNQ